MITHISELCGDIQLTHDACLKQKLARVGWTIHSGTNRCVFVLGTITYAPWRPDSVGTMPITLLTSRCPNLASLLSISTGFLNMGNKCLNYEQKWNFSLFCVNKKKMIIFFFREENTLSPPSKSGHRRLAVLSVGLGSC